MESKELLFDEFPHFSSRCCRRTRHVFLRHSAPPVLVVINIEMTQCRFIPFLSLNFLLTKLGQPSTVSMDYSIALSREVDKPLYRIRTNPEASRSSSFGLAAGSVGDPALWEDHSMAPSGTAKNGLTAQSPRVNGLIPTI
jgi:hypothetical protein